MEPRVRRRRVRTLLKIYLYSEGELTLSRYLFNPYTLLACLGRPTTVFPTLFVLLSINQACQAKPTTSIFALAMASYMSLHAAFLLPPIGMLCYDRVCLDVQTTQSGRTEGKMTNVAIDQRSMPAATPFAVQTVATFTGVIGFLFALSRLLLPSWQFIPSVYATLLQLPDLTPNIGLWWYFFIEMFDAFRSFFLGVFWLHMFAYSVPLCFRLKKQPLAAVILMMGICAIFEPYANVGNVGAFLSSLCLLGHVFEGESISAFDLFLNSNHKSQSRRFTGIPFRLLPACFTPHCWGPRSTTSGSTPGLETPIFSTPSRWCGIWHCLFSRPTRYTPRCEMSGRQRGPRAKELK